MQPEKTNVVDFYDIKPHTLATKEEAESFKVDANKNLVDSATGRLLNSVEVGALRKKFFTREYPKVKGCGHVAIPNHAPSHQNCAECWGAYFVGHPEIVQETLVAFKSFGEAEGKKLLTNVHGRKWVKYFMEFILEFIRQQQVLKAIAESAENPKGFNDDLAAKEDFTPQEAA